MNDLYSVILKARINFCTQFAPSLLSTDGIDVNPDALVVVTKRFWYALKPILFTKCKDTSKHKSNLILVRTNEMIFYSNKL